MDRLSGLFVGAAVATAVIFLASDDVLSSPLMVALRVLAAMALAGLAVIWLLGLKVAQAGGTLPAAGVVFGHRYAFVVAAEVALLFGGLTLLRGWDLPEQINVAWLAFVAGVHVIALARLWRDRGPLIPGVVLVMLSGIGFAMAATIPERVPTVIGVLSAITVLAGSAACSWRTLTVLRKAT